MAVEICCYQAACDNAEYVQPESCLKGCSCFLVSRCGHRCYYCCRLHAVACTDVPGMQPLTFRPPLPQR